MDMKNLSKPTMTAKDSHFFDGIMQINDNLWVGDLFSGP